MTDEQITEIFNRTKPFTYKAFARALLSASKPAAHQDSRYIVIGYGESDYPQASFANDQDELLDAVLGMIYTRPSDACDDTREEHRRDLADEEEWCGKVWRTEFEIGGIVVYDTGASTSPAAPAQSAENGTENCGELLRWFREHYRFIFSASTDRHAEKIWSAIYASSQPSPTAVVLDDERTEVEKFEKWWDKQRARAQEGNHLPRDIALSAWNARAASTSANVDPVPMLLHCPRCNTQHIDGLAEGWDNPPHRSHLCHACGTIWRPADTATTGVKQLETKGSADTWNVANVAPAATVVLTDEQIVEISARFIPAVTDPRVRDYAIVDFARALLAASPQATATQPARAEEPECAHPVVCPHAFLDDDGRWNCAKCMTAEQPASDDTK